MSWHSSEEPQFHVLVAGVRHKWLLVTCLYEDLASVHYSAGPTETYRIQTNDMVLKGEDRQKSVIRTDESRDESQACTFSVNYPDKAGVSPFGESFLLSLLGYCLWEKGQHAGVERVFILGLQTEGIKFPSTLGKCYQSSDKRAKGLPYKLVITACLNWLRGCLPDTIGFQTGTLPLSPLALPGS